MGVPHLPKIFRSASSAGHGTARARGLDWALSVTYPLNPDVGDNGSGGPFITDFYGAGGYYQCIGPVRGAGGRFNGRGAVFSYKFGNTVCP